MVRRAYLSCANILIKSNIASVSVYFVRVSFEVSCLTLSIHLWIRGPILLTNRFSITMVTSQNPHVPRLKLKKLQIDVRCYLHGDINRMVSNLSLLVENHPLLFQLRIFRKDPNAQAFFKRVRGFNEEEIRKSPQFKAHVLNVMASIDSAVVNLREPHVVEALMSKLGDSHCAFKVQKAQFEVFREVLVDMLQNDLKVGENVLASWGLFVDFIYRPIYELKN